MKELLNKKVKLDKNCNLSKIIDKLKELNVHTKFIEDKQELHSLFFGAYDTLFLLNKPIADEEFQKSELEEIGYKEFLEIIQLNHSTLEINIKDLFLEINTEDENLYINKNNIIAVNYKDNKINILTSHHNIELKDMNNDNYLKIINLL